MKPFDLEKAKAGAPVITKEGLPVRIICFDRLQAQWPLCGLVKTSENIETFVCFTTEGIASYSSSHQLCMAPVKKEGWINIYNYEGGFPKWVGKTGSCIYRKKEDAEIAVEINCVATIKIEWEE